MNLSIEGKEYLVWFEYKIETVGQKKPTPTRAAYCYLSDPDETWRLIGKATRFKRFSRLTARKQALGQVLKMQWEDKGCRKSAWEQIFTQMKMVPGDWRFQKKS